MTHDRSRPAPAPRHARLRAAARGLGALGLGALLLGSAGPAAAERPHTRSGLRIEIGGPALKVHGGRHAHGHRRGWHTHHGRHVHRHHRRHRVHRHRRHHPGHGHGYRHVDRQRVVRPHVATFLCAPCHHRFGSVHDFRRHLHHRHRVPYARFPDAVFQVGFAWIFQGR